MKIGTKPSFPPMTMWTWTRGREQTLHVSVKRPLMFFFFFFLCTWSLMGCCQWSIKPCCPMLAHGLYDPQIFSILILEETKKITCSFFFSLTSWSHTKNHTHIHWVMWDLLMCLNVYLPCYHPFTYHEMLKVSTKHKLSYVVGLMWEQSFLTWEPSHT